MDWFGSDTESETVKAVNNTAEAIHFYIDLFDENGNLRKPEREQYCPATEDISDGELSQFAQTVENFVEHDEVSDKELSQAADTAEMMLSQNEISDTELTQGVQAIEGRFRQPMDEADLLELVRKRWEILHLFTNVHMSWYFKRNCFNKCTFCEDFRQGAKQ